MDKMKIYETALGYHAKGPEALKEAKDKPPFDPDPPQKGPRKDEYGNTIKKKNIAKHLAKKGMQSVTEEDIVEALEQLEAVYEEAIEIQDILEEIGLDIEEMFTLSEEEVDESFQKMSKTKQLIARRRAGRRKKLTVGYQINRK